MKKIHKKKNGTDFFILIMLVLIMSLLVFMKGGKLDITGKSITGKYLFENEAWDIPTCTYNSAEDAAIELKMGYGCFNYCSEAAYGIPLPGNVIVGLDCPDNQQRSVWVNLCNSVYSSICA